MYGNRRKKKCSFNREVKKPLRKYVFLSLSLVFFILVIGFSYEKIGEYKDSKNYPFIGEMVEVNNNKINLGSTPKYVLDGFKLSRTGYYILIKFFLCSSICFL